MIPKNKKKFFKIIKKAKKKKMIHCSDFYTVINKNLLNISPEIIFIILFLSYSAHKGHTCLPIKIFQKKKKLTKNNKTINKLFHLIKKNNRKWFIRVINSTLCSNGIYKTPLVITKKYIYLYKYWYTENQITEFIYQKKKRKKINYIKKYKKLINKYCSKKIDYYQKKTIKYALLKNIFFILGGPGTGKTSILAYLILIYIKCKKKKTNIQLSAPTGKAATKLTHSIYHILNKNQLNKYERLSLPQIGITLHKLFNIQKEPDEYKTKNNIQYKKIDMLIIDEASMIDLHIMEMIATRIKEKTKIIFVGDINQLPPIETGSILKNICNYKKKNLNIKKIKNRNVFILKKKYRFKKNSGINFLTKKLEKNKYINISNIREKTNIDITWIKLTKSTNYFNIFNIIRNHYNKYRKFLNKNSDPKKIINEFNKYRILCAVKMGVLGTKKINKNINQWFIKKQQYNKKKWYHGKPIIIKKNNQSLQLMNGDIGICLVKKEKTKIFFIQPNEKIKKIYPKILLNYETAWSMTIHKSQGSEFSSIQIFIPKYSYKILSRELFYTAITRAKKKITLFYNKKILQNRINKKQEKYSGIKTVIN